MLAKTFAAAVHGVDARMTCAVNRTRRSFLFHYNIYHLPWMSGIVEFIMDQRMSQIATTSKILTYEK